MIWKIKLSKFIYCLKLTKEKGKRCNIEYQTKLSKQAWSLPIKLSQLFWNSVRVKFNYSDVKFSILQFFDVSWSHLNFNITLSHFTSLFSFYTPWKHQRISGFLMFSRGLQRVVKWVNWVKMCASSAAKRRINSFTKEGPVIQKTVHWFAKQITELVSIWQDPPIPITSKKFINISFHTFFS